MRRLPRSPAGAAGRNSAWSRAKSRCCRGTGNGCTRSRAAHRWRYESWSKRRAATNGDTDRSRAAREAAYHFMSAMAGNLPHFEEASRALFADDRRVCRA